MRDRSLGLSILALLALSCGDGESGPPSAAEAMGQMEIETCQWGKACGFFPGDLRCTPTGSHSELQESVDDGRVVYDSATLDDCLDAIAAAPCDSEHLGTLPPCDAVFEGTLEAGEPCDSSEECVGKGCMAVEGSHDVCG